jgi:hypothetical protein
VREVNGLRGRQPQRLGEPLDLMATLKEAEGVTR